MTEELTEVTDKSDEISIGERIETYLETDNTEALSALVDDLVPSEALREVLEFSWSDRTRILELLSAETASDLIREAPNELAVELTETLQSDTAAHIIDELDSDIQADVIGEMDDETAEAILSEMSARDAANVRRLAAFDDGTAGGLMISEAFTFKKTETVGDVLKRLASDEEDFERYRGQHPYIVDTRGKPVGVVSLRGLLTARKNLPLTEIMATPLTVNVSTSLDELRDIFDEHPFLGVPVIDEKGKLSGIVSRSALDEAVLERAESESLRMQGIVAEEVRSMPLLLRSRRRLAWLSVNIVLNIIAASVISAYETTLAAVIAIAVFLPMVSDMSGCSGNQAVAVTMRELSLGLVRPIDALRVWWNEASVGILNGLVLGLLIGIVAWIWKGNVFLGIVIGLALSINTVIAVSIGGVVPLVLKHIGQDPAVASGPLLTTITDMAGFFLVLSLATLFMPMLLNT